MTKANHLDKYVTLFREKMGQSDPLLQAVLTGHLIIETALDNILAVVLFHPEHVFQDARLSFSQKVHVVRAWGLRKNDNAIWELILAVNTLRNEIAHNLTGGKRHARLQRLRSLFMTEASGEMQAMLEREWGSLKDVPDPAVAAWACSLCTGFLGEFEADVSSLRDMIDALDESLNPDQPRFARKTPTEAKA